MELGAGSPFEFIGRLGGPGGGVAGLEPVPGLLERNLLALTVRNRPLAERVRAAGVRDGLVFERAADDAVSATADGRRLCSARRPLDEAAAFAAGVDPREAATACVVGFGLGHHARAVWERMGGKSLVLVYEPDLGLLRAVLERVDHTGWLAAGRCLIATDADDPAALANLLGGFEGLLALGVKIVEHAPSRARLGDSGARFGRTLAEVVRSTRTHVVTTLVHAPVTLRNMVMNADRYAACAGITALKDACRGSVAVTVAAGPSLRKNLGVLGEPGVRDRVVIIAAQTVLKPMLAAGIRPHFVTALDHHELSGRFYEGLTAEDVRGVRLVVEPKANPAILEGFPGEILCTQEEILDQIIGPDLARPMGELDKGSTVAHLSYSLARHLGCDPVVMIGQDLAFSDGQYYAAGAAIHRVWQGELNADRSLESLEWERIARMRSHLRRVTDQQGRTIYTDEQMATYLAQFESVFLEDTRRGRTIIDATEGGAQKRHTVSMSLRAALERHATHRGPIPDTAAGVRDAGAVRPALRASLEAVRSQAARIGADSEQTVTLLRELIEHQGNLARANALVEQVQKIGAGVRACKPGFPLTEFVNQSGVLNRFRADRAIELDATTDPVERQRRAAERDIRNVEWIGAAAAELERHIIHGLDVLDGLRGKATREEHEAAEITVEMPVVHAEVFVLCDPDYSGLGTRRELGVPVWRGRDALSLTLERVARCASVSGVRVLTPEPERTRALIERAGFGGRVTIEGVDRARWRDRTRAIGVARSNAAECWRGGVGQTTVFDESLDPTIIQQTMERHGVDACAVVGADWCLVDPVLIDALVERHRAAPARHQLAFSQAVPGLGGVVLGRVAVDSLVRLQALASPLATVGGVLGFVPVQPQADPIAASLCVKVDPCVRDAGVRAIADSGPGRSLVAWVMERLGERATDSSCVQSARALSGAKPWPTPRTLVLELCPGRLASADFGAWKRGGPLVTERGVIDLKQAHALLKEHTRSREDAVVVLDGPGDPLMHPGVLDIVRLADELGAACVHLRTDLLREGLSAADLAESGMGVLSVDLLATDPATYAQLTGLDRHAAVMNRLAEIASARSAGPGGLSAPWVMPRMTKCDATLEEVEGFYGSCLMAYGAAAIDPVPFGKGAIRALPVPADRAAQIERSVVRVRCDGAVCNALWRPLGVVNAFHDGLATATRVARGTRASSGIEAAA